MLSTKNFSTHQVATVTALPISLLIVIIAFFAGVKWHYGLMLLAGVFLFSYGLIHFTVQRFLYRKIKIIYKLIYQTKASKREEFYYKSILPQKSISEINDDVEVWAQNHTAEIDVLKKTKPTGKNFY